PFIRAQIETAIQTGHVRAHFRGVPPGSGPRLAFDADLDGQRDGEDGRRLVGTPVVGIRGHLLLNANREPRLGESEFAVVTTAAPDTVQGVLVVSSAAANLTISGVPVRVDLNASAPLIQPFWSDAAGLAFLRTPIPANPALIGLTLNLQAFFPDAATPVGVSASNGLEITIQPN
ncbi:MAG: hypothetical protein KDB53_12895, partial [Planctomycetes bacterium]|nr:hypothetical protein [Planctomycetota bacterium]